MGVSEARVEDERGRPVPVVPKLGGAPRWPWKAPPPHWQSPRTRVWTYIDGVAGLGVVGLAIAMSVVVAAIGSQSATTAAMFSLLFGLGSYFVINQLHSWHWSGPGRRFAARAMAKEGDCPSCGYGIDGVPKGDDGLTTCPECASAWRVS